MTGSIEARLAAHEIFAWWWQFPPGEMAETHQELVDGYLAVRAELTDARRAGDRDRAAALYEELVDLTVILGESCRGRDLARRRWLATDPPRPWPLGVW